MASFIHYIISYLLSEISCPLGIGLFWDYFDPLNCWSLYQYHAVLVTVVLLSSVLAPVIWFLSCNFVLFQIVCGILDPCITLLILLDSLFFIYCCIFVGLLTVMLFELLPLGGKICYKYINRTNISFHFPLNIHFLCFYCAQDFLKAIHWGICWLASFVSIPQRPLYFGGWCPASWKSLFLLLLLLFVLVWFLEIRREDCFRRVYSICLFLT